MNVLYGFRQLFCKASVLIGDTGRCRTVRAGNQSHFAHNHIRIIDKVAVHCNTVFIGIKVYPIGFNVDKAVTLLQKDDIRSNIRSRCVLKGVVRQTDCAEQISPLCNILPYRRVFFIHRTL